MRPIAIVLTLPLTLLTLGFFLLVINTGMVALVAAMLSGFHISGFWSAFGTALVVGVISWFGAYRWGQLGPGLQRGRDRNDGGDVASAGFSRPRSVAR